MTIKTYLTSRIIGWRLSQERLEKTRRKAENKRLSERRGHRVEYFHQVDDPYSHLMLQMLPALSERYDIAIAPQIVPPPDDWAAPERARLIAYSRIDAELLAKKSGLQFTDPKRQPDALAVNAAIGAMQQRIREQTFFDTALALSSNLWQDRALGAAGGQIAEAELAAAGAHRDRLGHYLGATCYYEGEWYWGVDRLHHLEARLQPLCRPDRATGAALFRPPIMPVERGQQQAPDVHFFLSFRSPYTYLATERIKRLADAYGAKLRLRYVLPMVMRNLPVKRAKGMYIIGDAAREARLHSIPFGCIADPVGKPVERGYALFPWAIQQGRGYDYCLSFLRHVWSKGVDAGSDRGLRRIVTEAGLDWQTGRKQLATSHWQQEAERNRCELLDAGLWGVPSFKVGDSAIWGQDRLWAVADALRRATSGNS